MLLKSLPLVYLGLCMTLACSGDTSSGPETVELVEIEDVLANPFKGFAPWIGGNNPVYEVKLQQATFGWRDLEPSQGNYNWSLLEANWGNVSATGKRVGIRVAAEIPGSGQDDTPQWLIDQGITMRQYSIDGQSGMAPDWDDARFLAAHGDFIAALGAKYDSDPRVAWIDIGSYGFWGEWHVWMNQHLAGTEATKRTILEHYFSAFPTKPKVIAFDDDFATEYVVDHGGGIRNDCLGTADANNWYLESLNRIDPGLNEQVWKTAIITGEFCGSSAGASAGTSERFDLNFEFIKKTHWSWIGSAGGAITPVNQQHQENLDLLHKTLGYRFVLKSVEHATSMKKGSSQSLKVSVENKGVAPFYFQWPVVLYLISGSNTVGLQQQLAIDIRNWLPGSHLVTASIQIPDNIASGEYDIRIAVHDPVTDAPGILFANRDKDDENRYWVGRTKVD